jgi:glycosyltransferase involved in cell wall biosynthesis
MTKKLLLIASYAPSLITFRYHLIQAMMASGYEVVACAPLDGDAVSDDVANQLAKINVKFLPIHLKRTSFNPFSDLITIYKLSVLMRSHKITSILSYTMKPVIYASIAAKLVGNINIYSMITGMGYVFSADGFKGRLVKKLTILLLRFAIRFNKKVFFQNSDNLSDFRSYGILKKNQQSTIINGSGICLAEFIPTTYPSGLVFLLVARLLVNKGIREYVAAANIIKKSYPHVRFLLVGWLDKNPNSITENELQSWINSSVIEYLGRLTDVRPAIAQASVFVLPSYSEGTPRSVLEAMAMSRSIITTDVPGCRETVIDGENGFLVPKQDDVALAAAMLKFINDPQLIATMGSKSRQIAVEKYDVHKVNQTILNSMEGTN